MFNSYEIANHQRKLKQKKKIIYLTFLDPGRPSDSVKR